MPIREITDSYTLESIVPYFQPIVDIRSEIVWRYECLARLVTPEQRVFLPSDFLYLIERNNHIHRTAPNQNPLIFYYYYMYTHYLSCYQFDNLY